MRICNKHHHHHFWSHLLLEVCSWSKNGWNFHPKVDEYFYDAAIIHRWKFLFISFWMNLNDASSTCYLSSVSGWKLYIIIIHHWMFLIINFWMEFNIIFHCWTFQFLDGILMTCLATIVRLFLSSEPNRPLFWTKSSVYNNGFPTNQQFCSWHQTSCWSNSQEIILRT